MNNSNNISTNYINSLMCHSGHYHTSFVHLFMFTSFREGLKNH